MLWPSNRSQNSPHLSMHLGKWMLTWSLSSLSWRILSLWTTHLNYSAKTDQWIFSGKQQHFGISFHSSHLTWYKLKGWELKLLNVYKNIGKFGLRGLDRSKITPISMHLNCNALYLITPASHFISGQRIRCVHNYVVTSDVRTMYAFIGVRHDNI